MRRKGVRKEYAVDDRDDEKGLNPPPPPMRVRKQPTGRWTVVRYRSASSKLSGGSPQERTVFELRHYEASTAGHW
ncbi:MAG: hypothetical protein R2748_16065 [Bryobacterales bacterium]